MMDEIDWDRRLKALSSLARGLLSSLKPNSARRNHAYLLGSLAHFLGHVLGHRAGPYFRATQRPVTLRLLAKL